MWTLFWSAQPLHEYGLYVEAAKAALNYRDGAQIDFEVHSEQLSRVKAEQNQVIDCISPIAPSYSVKPSGK